ncbi:phosphate/phosphite/phosphonate ABC transporter substrate-binding protein [Alkalimarinus alittae]|uniref:Phosphate/phosphite/phosphonate ABC transporter substrate-binding protein n=1 Tax=Alkalimarinus alittae TaxID=2961619 RepID=A0ABY6N2Z5_9ALTE|nr:phosphate/phosphite/phosphonate ABC transporter substrate-binding protein [Alkalimarinus alittae]UZE96478.1 phosphate/phosphite/phosphonate ABC transporter substrate-binding protein [Alkalimarinus alittae]
MSVFLSVLVLVVLSPFSLASDVSGSDSDIIVEINHDDGGKISKRHGQKLLDALAREGCDALSYPGSEEQTPLLIFDSAPVSTVAVQRPGYRLIARAKTLEGALTVKGAILVYAARGISDLKHLKGEWISFVGKDSWTGYRLPIALLNKAGVDETTNNFYFVGNHVGSVSALLHKDVLVAVVAEPLAQRWAEPNELSIVAVTDEVETGGWWLHERVSIDRAQRCAQALTRVERSELKSLPAWIGGFVVADGVE